MKTNIKNFVWRFAATTNQGIFSMAAEDSAILTRHELQRFIDVQKLRTTDEQKLALMDALLPLIEEVCLSSSLIRPMHSVRVRVRYASDFTDKKPIEKSLLDIQFECKACGGQTVLDQSIDRILNDKITSERAMRKFMLNKLITVLAVDLRHTLAFALFNTFGYRRPPPPPPTTE